MTNRLNAIAALWLGLAACRETPPSGGTAVVDSIRPMAVMLERFRADLPEVPGVRDGAPRSRDDLVRAYVAALAAGDTLAFEQLTINRAEWAWLYFPTSVQARPPYELPPGLAWLQLQQGNRTGTMRALRELGGRPWTYRGHECQPEPTVEAGNRIWIGCLVAVADTGVVDSLRLFSAILERDGRFLFLSHANDF